MLLAIAVALEQSACACTKWEGHPIDHVWCVVVSVRWLLVIAHTYGSERFSADKIGRHFFFFFFFLQNSFVLINLIFVVFKFKN